MKLLNTIVMNLLRRFDDWGYNLADDFGRMCEYNRDMEWERKAYLPDDIEGQAYLAQEEKDFNKASRRFRREEAIWVFIRKQIIVRINYLSTRYTSLFN